MAVRLNRTARGALWAIGATCYLLLFGGAWRWHAERYPAIECDDRVPYVEYQTCMANSQFVDFTRILFAVFSPITVPVAIGMRLADEVAP